MILTKKAFVISFVLFLLFAGISTVYTWTFKASLLELYAIQSDEEYEREYEKRRLLYLPFFAYLESHPKVADDIYLSLNGVSTLEGDNITFHDFLKTCYLIGFIASFALSISVALFLSRKRDT